ncbi:MAG TPA: prolyl oligopeptidase family serine peptidase [Streptosporangiaceae bacterium]|nr:prolyl oligopeptidase family serine peptidase [Streptosporangiaceae bacterium]
MTESFPRQQARTKRFSLGVPRAFRVSPGGGRVVFLRSRSGTDPVTCLWVLDVATGTERLVADPDVLGGAGKPEDLPPEERARRERVREQASGIVAYATDASAETAVFTLSGQVYAVDLTSADARPYKVKTHTPALDPRPDPTGRTLAYVHDGALRITGLSGQAWDRLLAGPEGAKDVTYGLPEFVAGEEMDRHRGYWWAPDGSALLVARVDNTPVQRWHIADPANPGAETRQVAYPAAGTANADVSLVITRLNGRQLTVQLDHEYLVTACWQDGHDPLVVTMSRDQRTMRLLTVSPVTGATGVIREDTDPQWLEIVLGVPVWTRSSKIVWTADDNGTRRLLVASMADLHDGTARPVTPPGLQVREITGIDGDTVLFSASEAEPAEIDLYAYGPDALTKLSKGPGVHLGQRSGGTTVIASRTLDTDGLRVVVNDGLRIPSHAEQPEVPAPAPVMLAAGERGVRTAVLFPSWHKQGEGKLPVLLDPYGGPHAQRVLSARSAYLEAQWFAEQGFAVIVADGRGTPGRGPEWERAVAGDLATPVLEDQVCALTAAAEKFADLDTGRVGIRGWSFGGYLSALAVLRRPDVFHAAVAGAPVTDWSLYDTFYTERYLGFPAADSAAYRGSSLHLDAERPVVLPQRPLLLIHGLADDNVVVAHTLRLSGALLAAGYPHQVLPLTGITHMASSETVAENLLRFQLNFLRGALGVGTATPQPR